MTTELIEEPAEEPTTRPTDRLQELQAMQVFYDVLEKLGQESRRSAIRWLCEALEVEQAPAQSEVAAPGAGDPVVPPADPRDFMTQKRPQNQAEKIACLGYYLTTYRGSKFFKSADLTALNTEAAQPKFGNMPRDVDNTERSNGYIVAASNGAKQLTSRGEAVVDALPDRDAVEAARKQNPFKARKSTSGSRRGTRTDEDES
ncbi:hypothetical protein [Symbioplanes lichenis]|uniref:hypothetical protein n=1 Tax=Symbioplanes lichenis TaxID=1629072 RepID=UPI002739AF1F|nr:hypothetical protein [Actinoplanes lichenis]